MRAPGDNCGTDAIRAAGRDLSPTFHIVTCAAEHRDSQGTRRTERLRGLRSSPRRCPLLRSTSPGREACPCRESSVCAGRRASFGRRWRGLGNMDGRSPSGASATALPPIRRSRSNEVQRTSRCAFDDPLEVLTSSLCPPGLGARPARRRAPDVDARRNAPVMLVRCARRRGPGLSRAGDLCATGPAGAAVVDPSRSRGHARSGMSEAPVRGPRGRGRGPSAGWRRRPSPGGRRRPGPRPTPAGTRRPPARRRRARACRPRAPGRPSARAPGG